MLALIVLFVLYVGAQLLFQDTLNKIQYVEMLRLYWITRDNGIKGDPFFAPAFMRQTAAPYWRGKGYQFRIGKYVFQIGKLRMKVNSLESQISNLGWLPTEPKLLRKWS